MKINSIKPPHTVPPPLAIVILILLVALTGCGDLLPAQPSAPVETASPPAPTLYHNGTILTLEPGQPTASAILIQNGLIAAIGTDSDLQTLVTPETQVIDLNGRTLMPGFVDAHTHILNDARSQNMSLDQAQMLALRNGITTIAELYVDQSFLSYIQEFERAGQLRIRTSLYLAHTESCGNVIGDWWKAYPPTRTPGEMLRIGGVKIFTDGGACGLVALSFDYDNHGLGDLWHSQEDLNQMVAEVQAAGHQAAIHAIGDRAIEQAQTAVALALAGGPNSYRHRLEHVSVITPAMMQRFGELGLIPVIPGQYPSCTPFGPPLPEQYGDWEWPWADLRNQNPDLPIAWHSDYPFGSINPFVHVYGFVTRYDVFQQYTCKPVTYLSDDTLPVEEALSIMTLQSAYAFFRENEVGSLKPGKYADLIIVSDNPLTVDTEKLRSLSILVTVVGGRVEYCLMHYAELCPGYTPRTPVPLPDYRPPLPIRWSVLILTILIPIGFGLWRFWRGPLAARLGGWAGILGGLCWILAWWLTFSDNDSGRWDFLGFPASVLLACATVGLTAVGKSNRLIWLALSVAYLAMITFGVATTLSNWFEVEGAWQFFFIGVLGHAVGLTLFGLLNLKARLFWRLNWLPLAVGFLGGFVPIVTTFTVLANSALPGYFIAFVLGLGWMAIGLISLKSQVTSQVSSQSKN